MSYEAFVFVVLIAVPYFVPSLIATGRKHPQHVAILMLNLLLGWTVLGWVGALVWACTNPHPVVAVVKEPTP